MVKSINIDFAYSYPFKTNEDYQDCFLKVFELENYDGKIINEKLSALYEELKDDETFVEIVQLLANKMLSDEKELGLYVLFSFDYLHDFLKTLKNIIPITNSKEQNDDKENMESELDFSHLLNKVKKSEEREESEEK